jgi:hypothetical protein
MSGTHSKKKNKIKYKKYKKSMHTFSLIRLPLLVVKRKRDCAPNRRSSSLPAIIVLVFTKGREGEEGVKRSARGSVIEI